MNIKSVIFSVTKGRISKLLVSTMFSTLTMNSLNATMNHKHNIPLSSSNMVDEKQFDNYKFGVDGKLGYASLIENRISEQVGEKPNSNVDKIREICAKISASNKDKSEERKNIISNVEKDAINKNNEKKQNNMKTVKKEMNSPSKNKINNKHISKKVVEPSKKTIQRQIEKVPPKVVQQEKKEILKQEKDINLPKTAPVSSPNTKIFNGKTYTIQKTISGGNATAYSSAAGGFTTSTGGKVFTSDECCCVAVDPKQIPYYSDLLIEFNDGRIIKGKALDTGSALRKHYKDVVVDIYMNTERECNNFGRQSVTVYVV